MNQRHTHRVILAAVFILALAAGKGITAQQQPAQQPQQPQPEPEQKMVDQTPVTPNEKPPDKAPEAPKPDEPPAALGSNIKGDGPDSFGLSGNGGGGSRFGWFASQVQTSIADALRKNKRTRSASLSVKVRIWPDTTGRITRAQLSGSTGDPSVDQALQNEILTGLQLQEPPPKDMPTPIVLHVTARKPN